MLTLLKDNPAYGVQGIYVLKFNKILKAKS